MTIYVIKQFTRQDNGYLDTGSNAGFFSYLERAVDVVENNVFDLSEDGYYEYTVILQLNEGLYQPSTEEHWYHWEIDKYIECEKPQEFEPFAFII